MRRKTYMAAGALATGVVAALVASNIVPDAMFGWGENIGWLNWRDANGTADGVVVHETFLSGYVWSETVGWIFVGDGAPTSGTAYSNTDENDIGVNIDEGTGDLSGLAWAENVGWINFETESAGEYRARYDYVAEAFVGYAWGENVGWIYLDDVAAETEFVVNVTQTTAHADIQTAINAGIDADELLAPVVRFIDDTMLDFSGKGVTLTSRGEIIQPAGATMTLADEATLAAAGGEDITLDGAMIVPFGDRVDLSADQFIVGGTGSLTAEAASVVDVAVATDAQLGGSITVNSAASLGCSGAAHNSGTLDVLGGTLAVSPAVYNDTNGMLTGFGTIAAEVVNSEEVVIIADLQVVGDYTNVGTTTVQNGVLTITGSLIDNGTMIGDVAGGAAKVAGKSFNPPVEAFSGGRGVSVLGDYIAGAGASLVMPSGELTAKTGGDFDLAINDNSKYDMALATLQMVGLAGTSQSLEVMSRDVGPVMLGLNRTLTGHYPIGTLRVGPTSTTVGLVDTHDNDGQGQASSEAVYANDLIIDADTTLNTNGLVIYYGSLTNNGNVDDPANLIPIVPVPGDYDNDGDVDGDDLAAFEACASGPAIPYAEDCGTRDFDTDNDVDQSDFAVFQRCYSGENSPGDPGCGG